MRSSPQVTLILLNPKFKKRNYGILSRILDSVFLCAILVFFSLLINLGIALVVFFMIIVLLQSFKGGLTRGLMPDWIRDSNGSGKLSFEEYSINVQTNYQNVTIEITHIKGLEVQSNYYQGFTRWKDIVYNGLATITIHDLSHSIKSFNFVIKNEQEFKQLTAVLQCWYKNKVHITEYVTEYRLKGFLLQCNLTHTESQRLKKEVFK